MLALTLVGSGNLQFTLFTGFGPFFSRGRENKKWGPTSKTCFIWSLWDNLLRDLIFNSIWLRNVILKFQFFEKNQKKSKISNFQIFKFYIFKISEKKMKIFKFGDFFWKSKIDFLRDENIFFVLFFF